VRDAAERAVTPKLCGRMKTVTVDSGYCNKRPRYLFVVEGAYGQTAASLST
jgi:hypothetical protein